LRRPATVELTPAAAVTVASPIQGNNMSRDATCLISRPNCWRSLVRTHVVLHRYGETFIVPLFDVSDPPVLILVLLWYAGARADVPQGEVPVKIKHS
jgi:hypothetical protein